MLANSVSPPNGGITLPCSIVSIGGAGLNVMSVCHISIFDGFSFVLSRICTSEVPDTTSYAGWPSIGPNRTAKARCCCGVMSLIAKEQHLMFEQRCMDRLEQRVRADRIGHLNIVHERAQRAGGFLHPHPTTALTDSGFL